jgi:eukaryotic-like serine/threonine-protein kinase
VTDYVLDDRYELIERIATGGMGEVWRGTDQILGRPVAIKMLAQMHAEDPQFRARFRAEARYASSLSHPGITRVFDYGENSPLGGPYLIMELVDGQPLSEILERYGRLDPYVVLDIIAQSAWALETAHQADIVHRDIKPGNLLIKADGTTKITDFGIAKANSVQAVNLTATGIVMGTALYVSPEQATGSPLTGSSDIYSLGVVAYECLAGDPPFLADQPLAIAIMHKHDPVPSLPPDVPRPVAELVYAMLAKTPDGRPESARHVADRAEVIRDARQRSGYGGPVTSDLPIVPNFPETRAEPVPAAFANQSQRFYGDNQSRVVAARRRPRGLVLAGIGAAACGLIAIVALMLSSSASPSANVLNPGTRTPVRPGSTSVTQVGNPTTALLPTTSIYEDLTGTNLKSPGPTHAKSSSTSTSSPSPTLTQPGSPPATPAHPTPPTSTSPSATATTSTATQPSKSPPPPPTTAPVTTPPTSASPTTPTDPTTSPPASASVSPGADSTRG